MKKVQAFVQLLVEKEEDQFRVSSILSGQTIIDVYTGTNQENFLKAFELLGILLHEKLQREENLK